MHTEILTTLLVFLSSANREIVKSTLGYIKLVVHTLPVSLVQPHLPALVPALLRWAHDHKNHFKPKVRHVFERMIRRFGFNDVYSCAGEEEARKVLVNIKKRKERVKRKKAAAAEEDEDDLDASLCSLYCSQSATKQGKHFDRHQLLRLRPATPLRMYYTAVKASWTRATTRERTVLAMLRRRKLKAVPACVSTTMNPWISSKAPRPD